MSLQLYAHPFSSYSQKVLIALYENDTPFEFRILEGEDSANTHRFASLWPIRRFPMLLDGARMVVEATSIVEYLDLRFPGPVHLIPEDAEAALEVRMLDRFFDNYISTPQQKIVFDSIRPEAVRDAHGVAEARVMLDTAYAWLDTRMRDREWAVRERFSLVDCGAAPFLFYADWTHAIADHFQNVHAYRRRLLSRPSVVRAVDEARPYRGYFPLGAPDRD